MPGSQSSEYTLSGDPCSDSENSGENEPEYTKQELVERKLAAMKKPPPLRDVAFFVSAGLSDSGINPHRMKCGREVSKAQLEALFGKEATRSNYRYTDCRDIRVREKVERIWPLCYGRKGMEGVKLLSLEFAMGIVADELKKKVDWAAFAEETNRTQRSKFTKRLNKLVADAQKAGVTLSVAHIKQEKLGDGRSCKTEKGTDLGSSVANSELAESSGAACRPSHRSSDWLRHLATEVNQLLQLCSMELEASKQVVEKVRKEKVDLGDKVRSVSMLLEHVQTSLEEQVKRTRLLEQSEKSACATAGGPQTPVTPKPSDLQDVPTPLMEQRIQERMWRSMVSQHEVQYKALREEAELKDTSFRELQQKGAFLERHYSALSEHLISLKKKKGSFAIFPHPLCYPSESIDPRCDLLRITDCICCRCPFVFNDIVVASCRHLYHPWCATVHFRVNTRCFDKSCDVLMSPEWYKSFGFREFEQNMLDQATAEGCEDARLQALNLRSQTAKSHCPHVGKFNKLYDNIFLPHPACREFSLKVIHFLNHTCRGRSLILSQI